MLAFFRKYQRFFYIVITTVVVISFSFFGADVSYQNPEAGGTRGRSREETVFIAIDGSKVPWREIETLALFIASDNVDKLLLGGRWGPNFLNDGVITKDFLETGMAEQLAASFPEELEKDLSLRQQKEKRFQFYQHPQAKFLNAANAWSIVAPEINGLLEKVKAGNPADPEAFKDRVQLYLAERRFPHPSLRMVLHYQQKQYQWISPDPSLESMDLALFGYHTLDDWFGPAFTRLVAAFIINSAKIAEKQGYVVSKEEVLADLYHNAQASFEQQVKNPYLGVIKKEEYLNEQLNRMGMDQREAVAIWRQVMLFRRLFHDLGSSVLVDPFTIEQLHDYTKEMVVGELYRLPEPFWLGDFRKLQLFEIYLNAVSERSSEKSLLALPETFQSAEAITAKNPELIERKFLIEIAQMNKRDLQAKVGVKETWNWEAKGNGWEKLKKQFPELGIKKGETEEERHLVLSELDVKTRQRVDAYARAQIVEENPSWLNQALQELPLEKRMVSLRKKGKSTDFPGLNHSEELIALLDLYPTSKEQLASYSSDKETYYRILVLDRSFPFEVMTFKRALDTGVLEPLLEKTLEAHYTVMRENHPERFRKTGEGVKALDEVRQEVAADYFGSLVQEIGKEYAALSGTENKKLIEDYAASLRFYPYVHKVESTLKKDPSSASFLVSKGKNQKDQERRESEEFSVQELGSLEDQWKVEKSPFSADRSMPSAPFEPEELFLLSHGEWSQVQRRLNGEIAFFQLVEKKKGADLSGFYEKAMGVQQALSAEAQRGLMKRLVNEMKEKKAFIPNIQTQPEV